jgi:hypothetical protein
MPSEHDMPFEFTLTCALADTQTDTDLLMGRLGGEGCTGTRVEQGAVGRIRLAFARQASTVEEAVRRAMDAVKRELPSAQLLAVEPDGGMSMTVAEPRLTAKVNAAPLFHDLPGVSDDFLSERASQHQPERESL